MNIYEDRDDDEDDSDSAKESNIGSITTILDGQNETTHITSMDCNHESYGLYWFNTVKKNSTNSTTLYRMEYPEDSEDTDKEVQTLLENLKSPKSLICDNDDEDIAYYFIGKDLYKVNADDLEEIEETGLVAEDIGSFKNLFYYEDTIYAASATELDILTDSYSKKWDTQTITAIKDIQAAAFFVSSDSVLSFLVRGGKMAALLMLV